MHLDEEVQEQLDEEPFSIDGLQRYGLQQALLADASLALEGGADIEQALQAGARRLQRSGRLPLAGFGERLRDEVLAPLPEQM